MTPGERTNDRLHWPNDLLPAAWTRDSLRHANIDELEDVASYCLAKDAAPDTCLSCLATAVIKEREHAAHNIDDLLAFARKWANELTDITDRDRERAMHDACERARDYGRTAATLTAMGCKVSFSDATDDVGTELNDCTPALFAQVDHGPRLAIFQGPARLLATFAHGFGWGRTIASAP